MADTPDPQAQVRRLYEAAESELARAAERTVDTQGFAGILGMLTSNVVAANRIATETFDLVLRNLRVAGRRDVVRLAIQLNRTEDKLEQVLGEVEGLRADLARERAAGNGAGSARAARRSRSSGNARAKKA